MAYRRFLTPRWWLGSVWSSGCVRLQRRSQSAKKSDADLPREGALALAAAHGEKPRYGGKFLSAGQRGDPLL